MKYYLRMEKMIIIKKQIKFNTDVEPANPSASAHTIELLPLPLGPITTFKRGPGSNEQSSYLILFKLNEVNMLKFYIDT